MVRRSLREKGSCTLVSFAIPWPEMEIRRSSS